MLLTGHLRGGAYVPEPGTLGGHVIAILDLDLDLVATGDKLTRSTNLTSNLFYI